MNGGPLHARRFFAPILVGGLLVASLVAAILVYSAERADARRANEALARQAAAVAERQIELTAASLRGGEGVLRRSGPMPEGGFRRFARDIIAETPFPALAWAPRVPARERRRFERVLGRSIGEPRDSTRRHPKGDLRPVANHDGSYLPIRFVHPDERGPRRELGLDLLSEPARAEAARLARDQNEPAITPPLELPGHSEPLVVLLDPVYAPGSRLTSERSRRIALAGMLTGAVSARSVREEIDDQIGIGPELAILDGETPFLAAREPGGEGVMTEVDVLGREWAVWVEEVERAAILPALAVGGVGLALAALAAALLALAGRREQLLSRERDVAAGEAETQRATASTLQRAFLPPSLPDVPGISHAAVYAPGAEGLEVGGDFYDLFATGDRWTALIGDVSGKGAQAASLTALVRHTARAVADRGPAEAVREVNEAVRTETSPGTFATMCLGSLRPTSEGVEIEIVVAGHPPPLVVRANAAVAPVQPTAPLVGVLEQIEVGTAAVRLEPGETLFLYTDGLIEARRRGGQALGEDRLRATLAEARGVSLRELISVALAKAREFSPDFPQDDVAILAIRADP
jgi:serine phosphatase RsbU (regulator of sigma subunit)